MMSAEMRRRLRVIRRKLQTALSGPMLHPEFVCATHYFGEGWALNSLQVVDCDSLRTDMQKIVDDGFNTVIFVVPWRGVQTDHYSPNYDDAYLRQLERMLAAAQRAGLSIIVRLSYAHQVLDRQPLSGITTIQRLLNDSATQDAWLDYMARVHALCVSYRAFRAAFLSWEEFWHAFWRWQLYKPEHKRQLAEETGYARYLQEQGIDAEPVIPRPEEADYRHFHAFSNHRIRQMHALAASRVPQLGIEIRVDKDKQKNADGSVDWLSNDSYTDLDVLRYTYWAPFMGAANEGEILSTEQAIGLLTHALNEVTGRGADVGHIVDQFNFVDDAPKFRGIHARIDPEEVGQFLHAAVPVMATLSRGFGIWAWRDYRQNLLYNARFLLGTRGWEVACGTARPQRHGGVRLSGASLIRQTLPARVSGLQTTVPFDEFELVARAVDRYQSGQLEARINAGPWHVLETAATTLGASAASDELRVIFEVQRPMILEDGIVIELRNSGAPVTVDGLNLFHVVFRGGFRDEHGDPCGHYEALKAFNAELASTVTAAATD